MSCCDPEKLIECSTCSARPANTDSYQDGYTSNPEAREWDLHFTYLGVMTMEKMTMEDDTIHFMTPDLTMRIVEPKTYKEMFDNGLCYNDLVQQ